MDDSVYEEAVNRLQLYDYIRFAIHDINGRSRGQLVPSRNVKHYLKCGLDMFEGLLTFGPENEIMVCTHENSYHNGNMIIRPDLETVRELPWMGKDKYKVAEVLCESFWSKDNTPQAACPRYVARQQLKRLDDMGLMLYSGFEVEYFLFHADTMTPLFEGKAYLDNTRHSKHGEILMDIDSLLAASDVNLERFHSEYSPGMFEAVMKPSYGIKCADTATNLKQSLVEIADLNGLKASHISRYYEKENGCGNHFSFSLLSKETKENKFYDSSKQHGLSDTAHHWIAGVLKHSKALTALTSTTPNCYRRLHQPWAPGGIFWGVEDRDASLRVKPHGPESTYFENRLPSGKSNPYIVMAATIAAGLDGVVNRLQSPPQGSLKEAEPLPRSLTESLQALKDDTVLTSALGQEFVTWFIDCKQLDVARFSIVREEDRFDLERKLYF